MSDLARLPQTVLASTLRSEETARLWQVGFFWLSNEELCPPIIPIIKRRVDAYL